MICRNCKSAIATARYVAGVGALRTIAPLCDSCAASLNGMGFGFVRQAEPVAQDTRPRWLRNLKAKDFSGSVA